MLSSHFRRTDARIVGITFLAVLVLAVAISLRLVAVTPVAAAPACNGRAATIYEGQPGSAFDGGTGIWTFTGTSGNDVIVGTIHDDIINGGDGNDLICGSDGNDTIAGDADNDTIILDPADITPPTGGAGYDYADARAASSAVTLDLGANGFERAHGSPFGDTFTSTIVPDGASGVVVDGLAGNDTITGSPGPDQLVGGGGDDTLAGAGGDDTITLDPADTIPPTGGAGYDFANAFTAPSAVTFNLGANGFERAYGSLFNDTFTSSVVPDGAGGVRVNGLAGSDTITGSPGPDQLFGDGDDDTINGSGGADYISGGVGSDTLAGDADNDTIILDPADITPPTGGAGYDFASAHSAASSVTFDLGANGFERAYGSLFNDTLTSSVVPDGAGGVRVNGLVGNDTITGSPGPDQLFGDGDDDTINGSGGTDYISGGVGSDTLAGDADNDTIILDPADITPPTGGAGYDYADARAASSAVTLDLGANGFERAHGSPFGDTFTSTIVPDGASGVVVDGLAGNDTITGSPGPDRLSGDGGDDTLAGAGGDDTITLDPADTIPPTGGAGYDFANAFTAPSAVTFNLGANGFERAYGSLFNDTFTSSVVPDGASGVRVNGLDGNDTITGSPGPDQLFGDDDDDTINGSGGTDYISGGVGSDTLAGDADNDTIILDPADTTPSVGGTGYDFASAHSAASSVTFDLGANGFERAYGSLFNDTFTSSVVPDGAGGVRISGLAGSDTITGSPGPDQLFGDGDDDTINGSGGTDYISGGVGSDTLAGDADNDTIILDPADITPPVGGTGYDFADGRTASSAVTFDVGANGFERADGSPFDDIFTSTIVPDGAPGIVIQSRDGDDTITGSPGDDTFAGGTGGDHFSGGPAIDTVADFNAAEGDTRDDTIESPAPEVAPTVSSTTPADNATDQGTTGNLTITFSEAVDVTGEWFSIVCGKSGTRAVADTAASDGPTIYTIDPTTDFATGESCTVTVFAAQVADQDVEDPPNTMAANYVFDFAVDLAPAVSVTTPADAATDQATDTSVTIIFDEPVDVTGEWFTIVCATSGTRAVADTAVTGGPTDFTINPTTDFTPGESCTVTLIAAQIADQDSGDPPNTLAANYVFDFTVDLAPFVTSNTPTDGATDRATNTNLTITFSEPVDLGSGWFTIDCVTGGQRDPSNTTVTGGAQSWTLDPDTDLPAGEICTVTVVASEVTDQDAGDPPDTMAADYTFDFGTQPFATVDSSSATGNIGIALSTSLLTNDEGTSLDVVEVQGAAGNVGNEADTTATGLSGVKGKITLEADGTLGYEPPPGFTGADTFTYRAGNAAGTSNLATVTINVSDMMWFICDNCGGSNQGTLKHPFTDIAAFSTVNTGVAPAPQPSDRIYIRSGTYDGASDNLTLRASQLVYGQGTAASSVFTPNANSVTAYDALTAGARPVIAPTGGNGINLANGNTVQHLNVGDNTTAAAAGISGSSFGTLNASNIAVRTTGTALNLTTGTLNSITFDSVTSAGGANGIALVSVAGSTTINAGTLTGSASSATFGVSAGTVNVIFRGTITQGNNAAAVSVVSGHSGALTFNTGSVGATSGSGLQFNNADGSYDFQGTTTLNGGDAGIDITNGSGGTFTFSNSTSILNPSGTDVVINGGAATFTYNGTITDDLGALISISSETGGTKSFTGAISDGNDGDGSGISLASNTGATINFSGGLLLSTGANHAFAATGGGTLNICAQNPCSGGSAVINTLTTAGGTALNVSGTNIGTNNLTFRSITANGGNNGIFLQNTGTTAGTHGGLKIIGTGSAGSGGTIQNTSGGDGSSAGVGIYIENTRDVTLDRLQLNGHGNWAIRGLGVVNFSLGNSTINGTNGTNANFDEGSIRFTNLTGNASITDSNISGGHEDNINVTNTSGTLDRLLIDRVTVGANSTAEGGDAIFLQADGTATVKATIEDSFMTSARGDLFQFSVRTNGANDLVFQRNALSNNHTNIVSGGGGFTISSAGTSPILTYNIDTNTFRDAVGGNLVIGQDGTTSAAVFTGTINNNTIGDAGGAQSGSAQGSGIVAVVLSAGTHNMTITNNRVYDYTNYGILIQGEGNGNGRVNPTVQGNTVAQPTGIGGFPSSGIRIMFGGNSGPPAAAYKGCVTIGHSSNASLKNTVTGSGINGGPEIKLFPRFSATVGVIGFTPTGNTVSDQAAMNTFLAQNNTGTAGAFDGRNASTNPYLGSCPP